MSDIRKKLSVLISAALFIAAFVSPFNADMLRTNAESFFVPEIVSDTTYTSSVDGEASQTDCEVVFEGFAENDYVTLANDSGSIAVMANEDDYQFSLSAFNSAPAGESVTISVNGNGRPDNWSCSSNAILSVYANSASVICGSPGVVTITASNDYCTDEITISFYYLSTQATTTMEEIDFNIVDPKLDGYYIGQSVTLDCLVKSNCYSYSSSDYNISWKSDDEDVAQVDSEGNVFFEKAGTATISAEAYISANSGYRILRDSITFKVSEPSVVIMNASNGTQWYAGNEYQLECRLNGCSKPVWSADHGKITEGGLFSTDSSWGEATITVTATSITGEPVSDSISVTWNSKSTHSVDISIDIDNYSHYYVGQTVSFTYYANDMYGYGTPSDYEISVSGDGKLLSGNCIELTGRGSVCLMITAYQETSSAMIWYKGVEMIDIESMAINLKSPDDSLMYVGSRFKLSYDSPENFRNVTWSSSDESVAEVDSSGYVTIKDYGAAKIYVNAESKYGEKVSDYITILLTSPIVIDLAEPEQSQLHIGKSFSAGTVSGDVMYTDWTSDNTSVASVDDSGMITINGPGRVTITVSVEGHYSNYATDSITFFVKNDPEISIVKPSSDLLFVTNEFQIEYKSYFADRILWSSSDTDVAEIDSFGNVSICGTGTVTIKASAYGNGITVNDSVTFAVSKTVPSGAALVPASVKLCPGEKCSLECVNLSDGTTVKYFSDKPEVAEINSGVITAKSLGETVIYAIADGEVFECRVSVCSKKQCSGDVDADGTFSTDDIVALRNYIFGIIEYIDFAAADLDGDGTVSSLDLALLRKMYAQSYNNV